MSKFTWNRVNKDAPSDRADFVVEWVKDLWRPDIEQAKGYLMKIDGSACCLGRACVVANLPKQKAETSILDARERYIFDDDEEQFLPTRLQIFLNIDSSGELLQNRMQKLVSNKLSHYSLACANDAGKTFYTIGKTISSYPGSFFTDLTQEEECYIVEFSKSCPKWEDYREARKEARCKAREGQRVAEAQA